MARVDVERATGVGAGESTIVVSVELPAEHAVEVTSEDDRVCIRSVPGLAKARPALAAEERVA